MRINDLKKLASGEYNYLFDEYPDKFGQAFLKHLEIPREVYLDIMQSPAALFYKNEDQRSNPDATAYAIIARSTKLDTYLPPPEAADWEVVGKEFAKFVKYRIHGALSVIKPERELVYGLYKLPFFLDKQLWMIRDCIQVLNEEYGTVTCNDPRV